MKKWGRIIVGLVIALCLISVFRVQVLQLAAVPLISDDNDHLRKADAILVLGGGADTRPFKAAKLFRAGLAPFLLVANELPLPIAELGFDRTGSEMTLQLLTQIERVPPDAVVVIGLAGSISLSHLRSGEIGAAEEAPGGEERGVYPDDRMECPLQQIGYVSSTFEEAKALYRWCRVYGAKSVIIVTNPFHSRRVRFVFDKVLKNAVQVQMATVDYHKFTPSDWWQSEEGLVTFNNEWIKTVYYWMKY